MAITASGIFCLTHEKMLIDTVGLSVESETALYVALIDDTATPNFDTMDFWNDLEGDEISGAGYTAGGNVLTGTEVTNASGTSTFDATDAQWAGSTITDAMGSVIRFDRGGASSADELFALVDFVTAASSAGGDFDLTWSASGILAYDLTP